MKKQLITLCAATAATFAIFAASDRIDIFDKAGNFVSLMVDDIQSINVSGGSKEDGYSIVNAITANGVRSRKIADAGDIIYMPVDYNKAHEIALKDAPNAHVVLYDCRNNTDYWGEAQIDPTKPADWHGCPADGNPHFMIDTDKGFASEYSIIGQYSGKVYTDNPNFVFWSSAEDNLLGLDSNSFDMPFEPIEIAATSIELDTYKDAAFIGTYTGAVITSGNGRIAHVPVTLTAEFRTNGTYVMKSTDENEFDFLDLYDWDEQTNRFAYVPYSGRPVNPMDLEIKTGVEGEFIDGGFCFAAFHDLLDDKPENAIHYIIAKKGHEYTIASADEYGYRMLVQALSSEDGSTRYFYMENYGNKHTEVTMEFSYGNNIGKDCTAFAISNGEKLFKYDYQGEGYDPVFIMRGSEYGSYTGDGEVLSLDGFGNGTFGGTSCKYIIQNGMACVTIDDEVHMFILDSNAHTYIEMSSDVWTGQSQYIKSDAVGSYNGSPENSQNSMQIDFDKNFSGADEPGTACVRFSVTRNDGLGGSVYEVIASSGKYIYNADSKTIIITNIYAGTSASTSGRRNLTLKVSDDLLSIWMDDSAEDRIYGFGRDGSYLLTGTVNTMTTTAPVVALANKYKGTPNMLSLGSATPTEATLDINSDNTATFKIIGMGQELINSTVPYEMNGTTLTLKEVTTYVGGGLVPEETKTDIVYVLGEDGSLTSTQTITGAVISMSLTFDIDLSSGSLVPEE